MKSILTIGLIILFACSEKELKTLDLGGFTLQVPMDWEYKEEKGFDSYVGTIAGRSVKLSFDYSRMGYASSLIETPEEYADQIAQGYDYIFMKPGVIYTTGNVEALRREELKKVNIKDTSKVQVAQAIIPNRRIYKPSVQDLEKYKDVDFMVALKYKDSVVVMPITVSDDIKRHNISIDTVDNYIVKLIWPKKVGDGMTGVYLKRINSPFNLQIHGTNLSAKEQGQAIEAFKTIKIVE